MRTASRGPRKVDGTKLLHAWATSPERPEGQRTQGEIAKLFGVTAATVSRWLSGALIPSGHHPDLIERVTGIARDSWRTARERKALAAAAEPKGAAA